jgi:hypothetical protein
MNRHFMPLHASSFVVINEIAFMTKLLKPSEWVTHFVVVTASNCRS